MLFYTDLSVEHMDPQCRVSGIQHCNRLYAECSGSPHAQPYPPARPCALFWALTSVSYCKLHIRTVHEQVSGGVYENSVYIYILAFLCAPRTLTVLVVDTVHNVNDNTISIS